VSTEQEKLGLRLCFVCVTFGIVKEATLEANLDASTTLSKFVKIFVCFRLVGEERDQVHA
jgi:hypothetical protein